MQKSLQVLFAGCTKPHLPGYTFIWLQDGFCGTDIGAWIVSEPFVVFQDPTTWDDLANQPLANLLGVKEEPTDDDEAEMQAEIQVGILNC